jgi:hypothetical protein
MNKIFFVRNTESIKDCYIIESIDKFDKNNILGNLHTFAKDNFSTYEYFSDGIIREPIQYIDMFKEHKEVFIEKNIGKFYLLEETAEIKIWKMISFLPRGENYVTTTFKIK